MYTIGLEGCDEDYLSRIANETGGKFISVENTGELGSIYQVIQKSLIKSYTIIYENVDKEADIRSFKIRCKDSFVQAERIYSLEDNQNGREDDGRIYTGIQSSDYFRQTGGSEEEY